MTAHWRATTKRERTSSPAQSPSQTPSQQVAILDGYALPPEIHTSEIRIIRREIVGRLNTERLLVRGRESDPKLPCHSRSNISLHLKHISERRIEGLGPFFGRRAGFHEFRADLHAIRARGAFRPTHAPCQQIARSQLFADFLGRFLRSLYWSELADPIT